MEIASAAMAAEWVALLAIGAELLHLGMRFVGIDFACPYVVGINAFNPGGLEEAPDGERDRFVDRIVNGIVRVATPAARTLR